MSANPHALRLLTAQKLDASTRNLTAATRRVFAAGRLAALGAHMAPGILKVRSVEHGEADAMTSAAIQAEVWLDARDDAEWRQRSRDLLLLESVAAGQGYRLSLAIYRADRWTRAGEWLRWHWSRVVG